MVKQLKNEYIRQLLDDKNYEKFHGRFVDLNVERVSKFSFILAVFNTLLATLPNLIFFVTLKEKQTPHFLSFLLIQLSFSAFMLLIYTAARKINTESAVKNKILLTKSFVLVILLHAFGLSITTYCQLGGVSIFLLTSCALLVALYWPVKRAWLYIGGSNILYLLTLYLFVNEAAVFHIHLISHLLFGILFFFISRSTIESKIKLLKGIERIENQTAEIKSSNKILRLTEHTLSSLNRNIHQGVFRLEKHKGFTYANDYLAEMLGYDSAAALITEKSAIFISGRDLEEISRKVNDQGYVEGTEVEISRRDGSRFWAQLSCSVRRNENTTALLYEGSILDISYRKKAIREALENAAKLEQAEKIGLAGFFEIIVGSRQITYSAGLNEILECHEQGPFTIEEHLRFVHPHDQELVKKTLLKAISLHQGFSLEYRVLSTTGKLKHLNSKAGLIRDEQGKKIKILGSIQDITAMRQSQKALAQTEAYINAAFNSNRYGIFILDTELKLLDFNPESAKRMKGWNNVELKKGMPVQQSLRPETAALLEPALQAALQGKSQLLEHKIISEKGSQEWAELYISPVKDPDEKIIGALIMGIDISERKRNEELLANLSLVASNTDNAVMISDRKHRVEWVNEAFERNIGFSLPEILNLFPKDFLLSERTDALPLGKLNSCLREGKSFSEELLICDKQGRDRWMHLTVNPVLDSKGKHIKFVSVYTDLSKIKAYEQQLQEAKEKAEHLAESKELFLSTVSHELRTPLNAVIGLTHHLLQNKPREDQLEDLNILKFSAGTLLSLINDILDLSKIEAGKVRIEKVVFNFKDIINSLKQSFQNQAEAKGLKFNVYLNEEVPDALLGDSVRLIQILANLLSNAIKFTKKGAVSLYIHADQTTSQYATLHIRVEDTGVGIQEDKLELIFDKFEQASQSGNRSYGGTGLGLAITKQLVELQGGEISVKSTFGQGSCFSLSLSYQLPEQKDLEPLVYLSGSKQEADLNRLQLLLVEDNKINQRVAGKFLEDWEISFDIAHNGAEAVKKAKEKKYDLILMDLQMPVMNGYEAALEIRKQKEKDHSNTPIIAITAAGNNGLESKIKNAGMTDIILKPFKPDDLLVKIQHYCPYTKEQQSLAQAAGQQNPELDLSSILSLAGEDNTFLYDLLKLYIEQFHTIKIETLKSLETKDVLELRHIFHKMTPSITMLRQESMQHMCNEIHTLLHHEPADFSSITPLTMDFLAVMEKLKKMLQHELENEIYILD